jgi:hypothetical protein
VLGEDIVYTTSDSGKRDERTGVNAPLVYRLYRQVNRRVAMCGARPAPISLFDYVECIHSLQSISEDETILYRIDERCSCAIS